MDERRLDFTEGFIVGATLASLVFLIVLWKVLS